MLSLAKIALRFSEAKKDDFSSKMETLFSIFRGDSKKDLNHDGLQGFVQLDSKANDGFVHETNEEYLTELGMNFSKATTSQKLAAIQSDSVKEFHDILDGEACLIHITKSDNSVKVITDPYGLFPVYYHRNERVLILSTDLMGILSMKPELR